jgi:hypothetical protein
MKNKVMDIEIKADEQEEYSKLKDELNAQEDERIRLTNELFDIVNIMNELYQYHPDNSNRIDVEKEFAQLAERKSFIQTKLG